MNKQADVEFHMLQDPAVTDSQFYHDRHLDPDNKNLGKAQVAINMRELIGGYARYKNRTQSQTHAASKFKSIHEASQIANLSAIDLSRPLVDTSFSPSTISMDNGGAARQLYADIIGAIGTAKVKLIEQVVIQDIPQRRLAKAYSLGAGGKGRASIKDMVSSAMDALARHFNL